MAIFSIFDTITFFRIVSIQFSTSEIPFFSSSFLDLHFPVQGVVTTGVHTLHGAFHLYSHTMFSITVLLLTHVEEKKYSVLLYFQYF